LILEERFVTAVVEGKLVGNSEVSIRLGGYEDHVGNIGIAIKKGYRDIGIGTEMMRTLINQGQTMGLRIFTLTAFADNKRAIHLYEKLGFCKTGTIPKKIYKRGKYIDEIIMTLPQSGIRARTALASLTVAQA
jgi:putative acetyltransferase